MKTLKILLCAFAFFVLLLIATVFLFLHHYHPSRHDFCARTPDTMQQGISAAAGNLRPGALPYQIRFILGSPYDNLDKYQFPDHGALGGVFGGVTRVSLQGIGTRPERKNGAAPGSASYIYDFTQAVLEVDGRQYKPLPHAWQISQSEVNRSDEITSPVNLDQSLDFDMAFPVEINPRSRIRLHPGTAIFNGVPTAQPAVDYDYCPYEDGFTPIILH